MSKSSDYWRKREEEWLAQIRKSEEVQADEVQAIYDYMLDEIEKEINSFFEKYAAKEGITMAEAKKRASTIDIEAYMRKTAKYVKEKDFSDQANKEMLLYNMTMKVNRLELLKSSIGLDLVAGHDELKTYMGEKLTDHVVETLRHNASILGPTIMNDADRKAKVIVNSSFHNATFSDRIWQHQDKLRNEMTNILTTALIGGRNPREFIPNLRKRFDVSARDAERLLRTEQARVQIEAQKESYKDENINEYEYIACGLADCCDICRALDGKHFKVSKMVPGENAPPMHPNCHCSTGPYIDRKLFDEYLDDPDSGDMTFEEWKKEKNNIDFMGSKIVDVISDRGNSITYHTSDINSKIHRQTYSKNSQKMEMLLDEYLTKNELDTNTFILKYSDLGGMSAYDHVSDKFYIAEELCDKNKFRQMVGDRFPAKNIEDVMTHEFEGHKNHWDAVKRYTKNHPKLSEDEAKIELESNLRKYVSQQNNRDISYISNVISENAKYGFDVNNSLNELIADAIVLVDQDNLSDKELEKLIKGVIEYDG